MRPAEKGGAFAADRVSNPEAADIHSDGSHRACMGADVALPVTVADEL